MNRRGLLVLLPVIAGCPASSREPPPDVSKCTLSRELQEQALGPGKGPINVERAKYGDTCTYRRDGSELAVHRFEDLMRSHENRHKIKVGATPVSSVGEEAYSAAGGRHMQVIAYRRTVMVVIDTTDPSGGPLAQRVAKVIDAVEPP